MPTHSVCRVWIHLIWGTRNRIRYLDTEASTKIRKMLVDHAVELGIEVRTLYVNPDHVHMLLLLPSRRPLSEVVQLLKGRSSRIVSKTGIAHRDFGWATGYAAFSVSARGVDRVARYINGQAAHHGRTSWTKVVQDLLRDFDLERAPSDGASPG